MSVRNIAKTIIQMVDNFRFVGDSENLIETAIGDVLVGHFAGEKVKACDLRCNKWYWMGNPQEGDIFYPCYVNSEGDIKIGEKLYGVSDVSGADFFEAIMPTLNKD